jgi:hypothetical protein
VSIVTSTSEHRAERGKPLDKVALAEWLLKIPADAALDSIYDTDMRGDATGNVRGLKATWTVRL